MADRQQQAVVETHVLESVSAESSDHNVSVESQSSETLSFRSLAGSASSSCSAAAPLPSRIADDDDASSRPLHLVWSHGSQSSRSHTDGVADSLSQDGAVRDSRKITPVDVVSCSQLVLNLHKETGMPFEDLLELDGAGILEKIPRNDEGEISSIGSLHKHAEGTCTPCIFWFRGRCTKFLNCSRCHFRHPGQKPKRHKPHKRLREARREMKKRTEEEMHG